MSKGEYQIIDNMVEYTNSVENQLIEYLTKKFSSSKNVFDLKKDMKEIRELIDDYNFNVLEYVYNNLTDLVKVKEEEEKEKEKEKEKLKKFFNKPFWEERKRKDGKIYWYNSTKCITIYEKPDCSCICRCTCNI